MSVQSKIRCSTRDIASVKLAPSAATQGSWISQNNFVGMWLTDRDSDGEAVLVYQARRIVAPCTAVQFTAGDPLYFHVTDGKMVLSAANVVGPVATLLEDKATATATAEVDLFGDLGRRHPSIRATL